MKTENIEGSFHFLNNFNSEIQLQQQYQNNYFGGYNMYNSNPQNMSLSFPNYSSQFMMNPYDCYSQMNSSHISYPPGYYVPNYSFCQTNNTNLPTFEKNNE